ncbi:MAG: alpha-rhamnosidase [Rikenellaceae bacterium]|nr:alpha-rhamnosidase [Rikenellaceae bacterium]
MKNALATWIWFPGDYEIWLGNQMNNRRTERGSFFPPFWKIDNHYVLVDFHKDFDLAAAEEITIRVEGQYVFKLDGKMVPGQPRIFTMPAGKHRINIKACHTASPPAIFVGGKNVYTDNTWLTTFEDKEWIDESGKVSDVSATAWLPAGSWDFNDPDILPSQFKLKTVPLDAMKAEPQGSGQMVDFGKETFGFIHIHGLHGKGRLNLYYGESREEALATDICETLDSLTVDQPAKGDLLLKDSKAFRFVNVQPEAGVSCDSVSMLYEYSPLEYRGKFRCSDEQINRIWDVGAYTMHLTSREFFIDGIKRDRWVWSGDASQSYLMNYYLFFDSPTVRRTMSSLRGKDPVTSHINTIMDYTFYWFISIYDYYLYTGDQSYIKTFYPRMASLMEYCLGRRNANGMMEGLTGDWIFIDWADGYLDKHGEVSFEQLLLCRSYETMALCAEIYGNPDDVEKYKRLAADLKAKLVGFWSSDKGAFVHNRIDGKLSETVTRYTNMFAIFFGYLTPEQQQSVKQNVLLNDDILKITTPYMRFYELEALCAMGDQSYVLKEMKDYWGGMLDLGATSFWEKYDPGQSGADHYAMYSRPFGKSLCHAWGASPIYLLGKYYLGVRPLTPGYATYEIEPVLGGLAWMEGSVPTSNGDIALYCSPVEIRVKADAGVGVLRFQSKEIPVSPGNEIKAMGNNQYELALRPGKQYTVSYAGQGSGSL